MALKENLVKKNTLREERSVSSGKNKRVRSSTKAKGPGFFHNEKVHQAIGVVLLLFALFLTFAFISYFFSWAKDDAVSDISFKRVLGDDSIQINNWTGRMGAALAHQFIKEWFGVASFLFILILLAPALRLIFKTSLLPVAKTVIYSIFSILWISMAIGFFMDQTNELYTILAGSFGYWSVEWFRGLIGNPGIILLLVGTMLIFLIVTINLQIRGFFRIKSARESGDIARGPSGVMPANISNEDESNEAQKEQPEWDRFREPEKELRVDPAKERCEYSRRI